MKASLDHDDSRLLKSRVLGWHVFLLSVLLGYQPCPQRKLNDRIVLLSESPHPLTCLWGGIKAVVGLSIRYK